MKKKFIYIGVILLVVAFAMLLLAGSLLNSTVNNLFTQKNVTVGPSAFTYEQVQLTRQPAIIAMISDAPVNFYVFNSTGFLKWSSSMYSTNAPSGYRSALPLEGAGLVYGYLGTKSATIPYSASIDNTTPFYETNSTSLDNVTGTYYAVVDNTNGSASSASGVKASVLYESTSSSLAGSQAASAVGVLAAGASFFVLLIAGIALVIYGIVKKQPIAPGEPASARQAVQKSNMTEEQIDQLYKNIKKKSQRKGRKSMQTKAE